MGYLRAVRSRPSLPAPDSSCLAAFESEFDYLFETLRRLGAAPREIEDLAQEVFVVLYRNWPTFDTTRPLRPYLFGVAFRIVCANRRRRAREIPNSALEIEDSGASPEGSLQSKESIALLYAALDRVPLPRRAVVVTRRPGCRGVLAPGVPRPRWVSPGAVLPWFRPGCGTGRDPGA